MLIKKIYLYAVLFATLLMTIGGSVAIFMAVADIVSPSPYYQSFEQYKDMVPPTKDGTKVTPQLSQQELKANYQALIDQEKINTQRRATNSLIKSLAWVLIPLPIFIYFQKKARNDT